VVTAGGAPVEAELHGREGGGQLGVHVDQPWRDDAVGAAGVASGSGVGGVALVLRGLEGVRDRRSAGVARWRRGAARPPVPALVAGAEVPAREADDGAFARAAHDAGLGLAVRVGGFVAGVGNVVWRVPQREREVGQVQQRVGACSFGLEVAELVLDDLEPGLCRGRPRVQVLEERELGAEAWVLRFGELHVAERGVHGRALEGLELAQQCRLLAQEACLQGGHGVEI